jgi:hypothetical protein
MPRIEPPRGDLRLERDARASHHRSAHPSPY